MMAATTPARAHQFFSNTMHTGIAIAARVLIYAAIYSVLHTASQKVAFPPLSSITIVLFHVIPRHAAPHVLATLSRWVLLFASGTLVGTIGGLTVGASRRVHTLLAPDLDFFRSLPATALLAFFLAIFGDGDVARGLPAFYITCFTVMFFVAKHVAAIDRERIRHLRNLGARWPFILRNSLVWEVATPTFIAVRQAISLSFLVLISIEIIVGSADDRGLGILIYKAKDNLRYAELIADLLIIGGLGYLLNVAWKYIQSKAVPWERVE